MNELAIGTENYPVLLGDIGATNARLAVIDEPQALPQVLPALRVNDFASLEAAIAFALEQRSGLWPKSMLLAAAMPLVGDELKLTNARWAVDPSSLMSRFGLAQLSLMNDFVAQGLAAIALEPEQLDIIGDVSLRDDLPKLVLGPGTGLGTVHLIPLQNRWLLLPSEAGHVDFGPLTEREWQIWPHLRGAGERVFAETVISGPGLVNLYKAVCLADGTKSGADNAASICEAAAQDGKSPQARAVRLFLAMLARHAGNLALTTLALGGVYLAGGMVARTLPFMDKSTFRQSFEAKDPYEPILRQIGCVALPGEVPALDGLAYWLRHPELFDLHVAMRQYAGN